jgi:hypothetical protein
MNSQNMNIASGGNLTTSDGAEITVIGNLVVETGGIFELKNRMQSLSDSDFVKYYIQLAKFVVPVQKSIDIREPVEDKEFEIAVLDGKGEVTDTYVSVLKGE